MVLLQALFHEACSQTNSFKFRKIGLQEGLSNGWVSSLMQDSLGFMWVGTQSGLNRFDGKNTIEYLPNRKINALAIDANGRFWAGTDKGLYRRMNREDGFEPFPTLDTPSFLALKELDSGHVLALINKYLYRIGPDEKVDTLLDLEDYSTTIAQFEKEAGFANMVFDTSGNLWVSGTEYGVFRLSSNGVVKQYAVSDICNHIAIDKSGKIWAGTYHNLYFLREPEDRFVLWRGAPKMKGSPWEMEVEKGKRMFNGPGGKSLYTHETNPALVGCEENREAFFTWANPNLDFSTVKTSFIDSNGLLWLGTTNGLVLIEVNKSPFQSYHPVRGQNTEGQSTSMRAIVENEAGEITMASYKGLFQLGPERKTLQALPLKIGNENNTWSLDRCYDLLVADSCLWCASESFGLLSINLQDSVTKAYLPQNKAVQLINVLHKLPSGEMWLGGNIGLFSKTAEEQYLQPVAVPGENFSDRVFFDLLSDAQDYIWLATDSGLYQLNPVSRIILSKYTTETKPALSSNNVRDLHLDADGILWLATLGGGLNRLDLAAGSISYYTPHSHGLPNGELVSIEEDANGYLWIGSFNGLIRLSKSSGAVRAFFESDGLTNSEFNHNSAFQDKTGRMYFGGIRGVNSFDPTEIDRGRESKMLLTQLLQFDSDLGNLADHSIAVQQSRKITIGPANPFFIVHFALADYFDPAQHRFSYKIEGIDSEWQDLGQQRMLRLGAFPKGNHRLLIRGRGSDGVWSKSLSIQLEVYEAFYQQVWFFALCLLAGIALVAFAFLWRIRLLNSRQQRLETIVAERTAEISDQKANIEKQAEQLRSLDETKSRFFTNISHELRTPLTLINGNLELLLETEPEGALRTALNRVQESGNQLRSRVEEILDLSGLEAGKMTLSLKPLHLPTLLDRLVDTFKSYSEKKQVAIELHLDFSQECWHLADSSKVEKIVQNLLSNAVKFTGPEGRICVSLVQEKQLDKQPDKILIAVEDTGQGIHPNDKAQVFDRYFQTNQSAAPAMGGTGIGLALCRELVDLMNGHISLQSKMGKGSLFKIEIPLQSVEEPRIVPENEAHELPLPISGEGLNSGKASLEIKNEPELRKELKNKVVLIVEDHDNMRAFIVDCLPKEWTIHQAMDGVDALEKLKELKIDLVVTDIMMPRMDGLELVRNINQIAATQRPSMLVLSARATVADRLEALSIGIDDYLIKPFHPQELRARTLNILYNRDSRKQWVLDASSQAQTDELPADQRWLKEAEDIVRQKLEEAEFGVNDLAIAMAVSSRTLTRRVREITGMTPLHFIREIRLLTARTLLEQHSKTTVAEVMYEVGFQSSGHFSRLFQERFGKLPSSYFE